MDYPGRVGGPSAEGGASPPPPKDEPSPGKESGPEAETGKETEGETPIPTTGGLTPEQAKNRDAAREAWKKRTAEFKGVPWKNRWKIEGPGFVLHCNSTEEVAEWYAKAITKIDLELQQFFRNADKVRFENMETDVFVYRNHKEYTRRVGPISKRAAGFFQRADGSITAFHGPFGSTGNTVSVLGHEYTHKWEAKVVDNFGRMPPWIYEGLAVYFGDGIVVPREGKAKAQQIPRERLMVIQRAIRDDRYIKIRDLLQESQMKFSGFHYAHAWSVIYHLVNTSKGNKGIFNKMFSDCIETEFKIENFENVCKRIGGIEGYEKIWKKWVLEQKIPPAGTVKGDTFTSHISNFSVSLPDRTWKFEVDPGKLSSGPLSWFQAFMVKGDARISIFSANNEGSLTAEEAAKRRMEALEGTQDVVSSQAITANGYDAYEVVYTNNQPQQAGEEDSGDEGRPSRAQRRVYLATVPRFFVLELTAPFDEFDGYNADFEKVIQGIRIHFD